MSTFGHSSSVLGFRLYGEFEIVKRAKNLTKAAPIELILLSVHAYSMNGGSSLRSGA